MALTNRQKAFVDAYLESGFDLRVASKKTKYKLKYCENLLKKSSIIDEIDYVQKQLQEVSKWNQKKMLEELTTLYDSVKENKSKREALSILQEIGKILGIHNKDGVELPDIGNIKIEIINKNDKDTGK